MNAKLYKKKAYENNRVFGLRKNKANSKPISVKKCPKCPIHMLVIGLFELYQCDPFLAGAFGLLVDGC